MARRKRRTFSAEFKFETVIEALRGEKSAARICRERDISENLLSRWKREFLERGAEVFESWRDGKTDEAQQRITQTDFDDAYAQIEHWLEQVYNAERVHSALGYLPPAEFEAAFRSQKLLINP